MKIIFATGNENKMREIREILGGVASEINSMKDEGIDKATQRPVPGKIIVYYNHKGFVPDIPWYHVITTEEYTPIVTDGCVPTEFDMKVNGIIRLEDSYCCIGINEIIIHQYEGKKAVVYSKDGEMIFNGWEQPEGSYRLRCVMTPFTMIMLTSQGFLTYSEQINTGLYNGTNDRWTVERMDMI